jgi:MFS transporter, SHS family, lactate transporter
VVPVYLVELPPGDLRTFIVGTAYQLGNLASSASSTIETTLGERFPIAPVNGQPSYDYGSVMAILMACVFRYGLLLICTY